MHSLFGYRLMLLFVWVGVVLFRNLNSKSLDCLDAPGASRLPFAEGAKSLVTPAKLDVTSVFIDKWLYTVRVPDCSMASLQHLSIYYVWNQKSRGCT